MTNDKQVNPADGVDEEPGRSLVSPQPINWNDSCIIPPRAVNKRAKHDARELSANEFDVDSESA